MNDMTYSRELQARQDAALAELNNWTMHDLVIAADTADPDSTRGELSPGADMLDSVLVDVKDRVGYVDDVDDLDPDGLGGDTIHEIADSAPSVYTYERWRQFVDLAAWDEDTNQFGDTDMTTRAGYALYEIAYRLAYKLLEAAVQAARDAADEWEGVGE